MFPDVPRTKDVETAEYLGPATGPHRVVDLRRIGLPGVQPRRCGTAVPGICRSLRAAQPFLVTSNLAFSEWSQVFQGERMTVALLEGPRLRGNGGHRVQHSWRGVGRALPCRIVPAEPDSVSPG